MDELSGLAAFAHPQGADPFWAVDLVGGDGDQVWTLANFEPSQSLDSVALLLRTGVVRLFRDFRDRLSDADLVIHLHDRDEQDSVVEFTIQKLEIQAPVRLH